MTAGPENLDARLLRYRSQRAQGDAAALAEALLEAGRVAEAIEVASTALAKRPDDGALLLADGRAKLASGDLLGAQAGLLKAARVMAGDKRPFRWLGEVLLKRGDPSRAAKVLERALAIDPADADVRRLAERAARLDRVAASAVEDEPAPPPPPPKPEERTVMRTDLTEQLRSMTLELDRKAAAESGPAGPASAPDYELDDEPTSVHSAEHLVRATAKPAAAPLPAPQDRLKARKARGTLALGSAPTAPRPPARPLGTTEARAPADDATSVEPIPPPPTPRAPLGRASSAAPAARRPATITYEASPLAAEAAPPAPARRAKVRKTQAFGSVDSDSQPIPEPARPLPPKPPHLATSPGAAVAPVAAPLKRTPPSARGKAGDGFEPSEDEIEDALGNLEGDPFAPVASRGSAPAPATRSSAPPAPPFADPIDVTPAPIAAVTGAAPGARRAAPEPAPPPEELGPDPFGADPFGAPPVSAPTPDVAMGGEAAEDVDAILEMLQREGLFEPPSAEVATWAKRAEVKTTQASGTRIGLWMGLGWVLAIGLAVGGWFGWQEWLEHRHAQAAALVTQARAEAYAGDHADLVDAERHLREARDLSPHDVEGPTLMLFVHAQRALEDGAFEAGFIRPTIAYAERILRGDAGRAWLDPLRPGAAAEVDTAELEVYLHAARAVLAAAEGGHAQAREHIRAAREARPDDPAILYLSGRLEQRLGSEDALAQLEAATEGRPPLTAARIALAEARADQGAADEAQALLAAVLADDPAHLRARLFQAFSSSDSDEPDEALARLAAMRESIEQHGAPTDHLIHQLTRARLLRRKGDGDAAGEAVDQALRAGASEPRLLALVATEGRRAGRLLHAERAARTAVTGAPSNTDFRKLLAEIQLARHDGRGALGTLAELDADDPDVVEMRARAALLLGTAESIGAAAEALDAYVAANEDASVEVRALRIRLHVRQGDVRELLPVARALVTEAPGDPSAALALGEVALRLFEADTAVEALGQVVQASPDDAEGHFLLGRARRMQGDAEGAEASLRRALELVPEHTEARMALGALLLDTGDYEAADAIYAELARSARAASGQAVTIAGRLGRVEALVGRGALDDAAVQLEALRPEARETPSARMAAARLALARGQAGEALTQLRPLATEEGASATVLSLYGDALLAAGQAEPAAEAYDAAVAADAGSPEGLIGQAELAVRSERDGPAIELLERVEASLERRIRPPAFHARRLVLLGRAQLLARGGEEAARASLRAAIETEAAPPEAHFFLGESLARVNTPEARAAYQRYLELSPEGQYAARARRASR